MCKMQFEGKVLLRGKLILQVSIAKYVPALSTGLELEGLSSPAFEF